ncbi:MAG TPA: undecaprenyl-diphosphate phosphatase [bacterium]|nr:undecaprenyl-diphosphate phosphatase [bacterium]
MSDPLTVGQAILLGVIQGLTEFLPVSSSGHLALAEAYLRIPGAGIAVAVLLHAGTLLAIALVFPQGWKHLLLGLRDLFRAPFAGPSGWSEDARLAAQVTCAAVPGAVVGLTLADRVVSAFHDPRLVGVLLLVTAGLLFLTRRARMDGRAVGFREAWLVGAVQALAILPGISRSGATIAAALLIGVSRPAAAEFSFLAAIPLVVGSTLLSVPELGRDVLAGGAGALLCGFLTSCLVGWAALAWLVRLVRRGQLHWFGFYCAVVGTVVLLWPPA